MASKKIQPYLINLVFDHPREIVKILDKPETKGRLITGMTPGLIAFCKSRKKEFTPLQVENCGWEVNISRKDVPKFMDYFITYYSSIEEYELCAELSTLKTKLQNEKSPRKD